MNFSPPHAPPNENNIASHHDSHSEEYSVNHRSLLSLSNKDNVSGGNILYSFVKQLRPGMDLVSLSCPSFVLSPFSYLEARTDYIVPLPCLMNINQESEAVNRFLRVCQWVVSSLTFIPSCGVSGMKPYNPVLGEKYSCVFMFDEKSVNNTTIHQSDDHYHMNKYKDSTYAYAEQVSHHPPISCQYMCNEKHQFKYASTTQFQVKFKGTYVETQITPLSQDGVSTLELTGIGEKYQIRYPNIVVTGLFWGTTQVSHDGLCEIICEKTGLHMKLNCSSKKHCVDGEILYSSGGHLIGKKRKIFCIRGNLDGKIEFTECDSKRCILSIDSKSIEFPKKLVRPIAQQDDMESRKVWERVSKAILEQDFELASREKNFIEEAQRLKRSQMDIENYEPSWWTKQQPPACGMPPSFKFKEQRMMNLRDDQIQEEIQEEKDDNNNNGQQHMQKRDLFTNYVRRQSLDPTVAAHHIIRPENTHPSYQSYDINQK